jgi:hypothetical protein
LQKLKIKLENFDSSNKQPEIDTYTQQIIDAATLNSNLTSNNTADLDDIFYDDPDDEEEEEENIDDTME